jgi:hypothetical protein
VYREGWVCALSANPITNTIIPTAAIVVPAIPVAIPHEAIPAPRIIPPDRAMAERALNPSATAGTPVSPHVTMLASPSTSEITALASVA